MNKKGFSLIEILVVITIIGILAGIAIPAYIGQQKRASRTEAYANLESLRLLQEQFYAENANYAPLVGGTSAGVGAIQGDLAGFRPGTGLQFDYAITQQAGVALPTPVPVPYDNTTANLPNANTPCFRATATGRASTRVAGDVFAIDCMNNRNF